MRRTIAIVALLALLAGPAEAKTIGLQASPNPARVGERVVHTVDVAVSARLDVWVSARGFEKPRLGTLPQGGWVYECCPSQTAGTPAWHFRSSAPATTGARYRFGADARLVGTYLATAAAGGSVDTVWISVR